MKSFLVITFLCVAPCLAQRKFLTPVNGTSLPKTTSCYHGSNNDYMEKVCTGKEDMCSTVFRIEGGVSSIEKSCSTRDNCLNDARSSRHLCTGFKVGDGKVSRCSFCCVGKLCNFLDSLPQLQEAQGIVSSIRLTG